MEHTTPQSETLNVLTGNRIAAMMTDEVEMGNLVDLPEGAPTWSGIGVITPPDDTFKEQPQQEDNGSQSARPALLPKQDETPQQVLGLGQAPIEQSGIASFDCSSYDFSDRSPLLLPELSPQLIDGVVNAAELVYDHDENSSTITSARTESIAARDSLDYTADIGLSPVAESVTAHIEDADEEPSAYIRRGSLGSPRLGESTGCHSDSDHTISSNATASSGKCRAVSSSFEPAPIQRLPDSVLKRIFVLLAMPEGVELPNNVQEKGDAACWAWQLLKWRRWGGTLRLVCKTWTPLVDQLDIWLEVASTFMGNTPERLSNYPLSPFIFANLVLYSCCWACRINLQKFNAANSLRASSALGPVLLCQTHSEQGDEPVCGNCLIDSWRQREPPGQQQRTWQDLGRIVENDDEEYFEDVQVTCKDCRHNAFLTAYADSHEQADLTADDVRIRELKGTIGCRQYILEGSGSASNAVMKSREQLWLQSCTSYYERYKAKLARRNHERRAQGQQECRSRRRNGFGKPNAHGRPEHESSETSSESLESESEEEGFSNLETLDDADEAACKKDAFMQYCLERLHSGFWLSPAEQLSVERQRGRLPLHGWPVLPGTGQTRPSGAPALTSDAFGMHLGELAPLDDFNYPGSDLPKLVPQTLLSEVERYWPRALKEHFSFPFANIVVDLRENNSGLEIAADMDVKGVLLQCQRAHMWARPYARRPAPRKRSIRVLSPGKKAARSSESGEAPSSPPFSLVPPKPVDLPLTPDDSADIGLRTAEDMMELWKQSWGPLEECNCGICARGKRMREDANREYPDKFARI